MPHLSTIGIVLLAFANATRAADMCTATFRAIDVDTGTPIPGVEFDIENDLAEDWWTSVGEADTKGVLRVELRPKRGYHASCNDPEGYKVVGLDDRRIDLAAGTAIQCDFQLRKWSAEADLPPVIEATAERLRQTSEVQFLPGKNDTRAAQSAVTGLTDLVILRIG